MRPVSDSTQWKRPSGGFTIIELLVTVFILSILAGVTMPMAELVVQRGKEERLRMALQDIRQALDRYKKASDEGRIAKQIGDPGYPPSLDTLVAGVVDLRSPNGQKLYFLRRVPSDPMASDARISPDQSWGKRSYASSAEDPREGADVYDIYSLSEGVGLNGVPYRQW